MTNTWDVIVVGAGLAGLAAGATAAQEGGSVLVLDARAAGGRARTTSRDGFVFNLGPHALYLGGEGYEVLRRLGVTPKGTPPPLRDYRVLAGGTLHQMPAGPGSLVRTSALGARSKASLARLLALLPRIDASRHAHESVLDWIGARELRPDAESMLRALIRIGTYCNDFDELSAEAAIVQLQRAAAAGVLYLDGGWSQLVEGLRARLDVRTRSRVQAIDATSTGVVVDTLDETFRAGAVVIAAGTPPAARALLPANPGWRDVGEPLTAACLDVGVRGVPDPGYVLGVDDPIYGTTQSPPARQAPAGDAVVAVVRYGARTAAEDRRDLERWLDHLGVRRDDIVVERFLARMVVTGAKPLAVNGGFAGRPEIDATATPNVFIAGDWVGRHGLLADASLASGHAAGRAARRVAERSATMVG